MKAKIGKWIALAVIYFGSLIGAGVVGPHISIACRWWAPLVCVSSVILILLLWITFVVLFEDLTTPKSKSGKMTRIR